MLLTVGLVLWIENMVTVEWTYPYCLDRSDGPAYAAYGMPLAYVMWNGVVSLEHDFVPHVYILNIAVLCLISIPAMRWILNRVISLDSKLLRSVLGGVGCLLIASHVTLTALLVSGGFLRPARSLSHEGYYQHSELRPVRIGLYRSSAADCEPSPFWFPDGWQHK